MTNEKLIINRTVGFEFEGYINRTHYSRDLDGALDYADVGGDASLGDDNGRGVEVKTIPLTNLNYLEPTFNKMHEFGWFVNERAGLHIHVDISDLSIRQRVKMLRFFKGIEYLMYAINKPYRYYGVQSPWNDRRENGYCVKLHKDWRKVFRSSFIAQPVNYREFDSLDGYMEYIKQQTNSGIWNRKYAWANANTRYDTVEFRIFEAVNDKELAEKFGMLAYHLVETVKHSTLKQLMFIKKNIYKQTSVQDMLNTLYEGIGLDSEFHCVVRNEELANEIDEKFCKPIREGQEVAVEAV